MLNRLSSVLLVVLVFSVEEVCVVGGGGGGGVPCGWRLDMDPVLAASANMADMLESIWDAPLSVEDEASEARSVDI